MSAFHRVEASALALTKVYPRPGGGGRVASPCNEIPPLAIRYVHRQFDNHASDTLAAMLTFLYSLVAVRAHNLLYQAMAVAYALPDQSRRDSHHPVVSGERLRRGKEATSMIVLLASHF